MSQMTSKARQTENVRSQQHASTRQNSASISPPSYGIGFIDHNKPQQSKSKQPNTITTSQTTGNSRVQPPLALSPNYSIPEQYNLTGKKENVSISALLTKKETTTPLASTNSVSKDNTAISPTHPSDSKIINWIAEKASTILGFPMLTVAIGYNPITGAPVERSAGNILKSTIEIIPSGNFLTQALDNHNLFTKVSVWTAQQFEQVKNIGSNIWQDIKNFANNFSWYEALNVFEQAKSIITAPIGQIKSFAIGLKDGMVGIIKDAILKPIADFAKTNSPNGYELLSAVLGYDPISSELVQQTPETLIAPFMKLIGQEDVWQNMKEANAIPRAWAWFQTVLPEAKAFVNQIPTLFIAAFKSLDIIDIVFISQAFAKLIGVFSGFVSNFTKWAGNAVWNLLEIIFDVVKPGAMSYIKKTGAALKSILKNPLPFAGNLVKAAVLGFQNFSDHIGDHLKTGMLDWLVGSLSGVYIPKELSLPELGKLTLSILGITWQKIRSRIVEALGANGEKIMQRLETGVEAGLEIVAAFKTGGTEAVWELIKEKLVDLKNTVINKITGFVTDSIIKKAIPKLISLFIPGAGFISAIISIYDTVMVFVEKISKFIQVVTAFVDSIVAIAAGDLSAAANRIENTLAGLLSLAINFLAGFFGLDNITDSIKKVIENIRTKVDEAIKAAITWIVEKAKNLYGKAKSAVGKVMEWWKQRSPFKTASGESHEVYFVGDEKNAVPMVASNDPQPIENKLNQYIVQANKADASDEQKNQRAKISATKAKLKVNPIDTSAISIDLQGYFNLFEEKVTKKETKLIKQESGKVAGDKVCVHMIVDWLDVNYAPPLHGSIPKKSALKGVMDHLVTKKKTESKSKYIKGHLLNHNLGGEGDADNMFPITGLANSQHLHSTETKIKNWLEGDNKTKPTKWVWYEVKVDQIYPNFPVKGKKSSKNYVNCTFNCMAILKNAKGVQEEMLVSTITSKYQKDTESPLVFEDNP